MIDAHQRGGMPPAGFFELSFGYRLRRRSPRCGGNAGYGSQRPVELRYQGINARHAASLAEKKRAPEGARQRLLLFVVA
jgi:hypothetical protein